MDTTVFLAPPAAFAVFAGVGLAVFRSGTSLSESDDSASLTTGFFFAALLVFEAGVPADRFGAFFFAEDGFSFEAVAPRGGLAAFLAERGSESDSSAEFSSADDDDDEDDDAEDDEDV